MKKIISLLLILFIVSGCSYVNEYLPYVEKYLPLKQNDVSSNHINELETKFEYKTTTASRNYLEAVYLTLDRGDTIEVIDEDDRYYYFKDYNLVLATDKRLVRDVSQEDYEGFKGYTKAGAIFYSTVNMMDDDATHTFTRNEVVEVIDLMDDRYYVLYNDEYGFVFKNQISKTKYTYVAPKVVEETYDYSGGGGGGSYSDPNDGEDIVTKASYNTNSSKVISLASDKLFEGKILTYDQEAYVKVYSYKEEIKYIDEDENTLTALVDGYTGKVKKSHSDVDEEVFEDYIGYTYAYSYIYYDYYLDHTMVLNKKNDKVHVIDKVGCVLIIELDDGTIGYMNEKNVSKKLIVTYVKPVEEETPTYSGGGGSSADVYTPPVL